MEPAVTDAVAESAREYTSRSAEPEIIVATAVFTVLMMVGEGTPTSFAISVRQGMKIRPRTSRPPAKNPVRSRTRPCVALGSMVLLAVYVMDAEVTGWTAVA
jgi:hypothetical protein